MRANAEDHVPVFFLPPLYPHGIYRWICGNIQRYAFTWFVWGCTDRKFILHRIGGDMQGFILRIICLLIFFAAIVFATLLGERCTRMKLICVVTDVAMVIILGLLPRQLNRIIYLYPISFAMTVQWLSFRGIEGCYSATPFTTNNLRQFMTALIHLVEKEKVQRKKMRSPLRSICLRQYFLYLALSQDTLLA